MIQRMVQNPEHRYNNNGSEPNHVKRKWITYTQRRFRFAQDTEIRSDALDVREARGRGPLRPGAPHLDSLNKHDVKLVTIRDIKLCMVLKVCDRIARLTWSKAG